MFELSAKPEMNEYLNSLRRVVSYAGASEVSTVIAQAKKNIQTERKRKKIDKKTYLAELRNIVEVATYRTFTDILELKNKIQEALEQEFKGLSVDMDFSKIEVNDETYVYGINVEDEDNGVYTHRMRLLDEVEVALEEIEKVTGKDSYEVELAALRKKYNKE